MAIQTIDAITAIIQTAPYELMNIVIIDIITNAITTPHTINPIPLAIFPTYTCPRPVNKNYRTAANPALFRGLWY